jgi:carbamoyltransferase
MIFLSFLHWYDSHDSSAALVRDGQIVAAIQEERLSRSNHDGGVPLRAIAECLRMGGVQMRDVDAIVFPGLPYTTGPASYLREASRQTVAGLHRSGTVRLRARLHRAVLDRLPFVPNMRIDPLVGSSLLAVRQQFGHLPPLRFVPHHFAHAASAFLTSGFDGATVVTLDGRGGLLAGSAWTAADRALAPLFEVPFTNSLGFFYRDATAYAGLGAFGEGKLMGLAAYGDPRPLAEQVESLLHIGPDGFRYRAKPSAALLGFGPRGDASPLEAPWPDFAAAVQQALERAVLDTVRRATATRSGPLCLAGGVALNCATNGMLAGAGVADRIWIHPAAGDAGLPIGAALWAARTAGDPPLSRASAYLGPEFDSAACQSAAAAAGLSLHRPAQLEQWVAGRIADGAIVGWFQGRMEVGPRALGNRSILADPRNVATRDRVNRLKGREAWRPLAPAVLAEHAHEYFALGQPSPHMLLAAQVTPMARQRVPATVHVDGTARPQTVTSEANPRLHALLRAFEARTGVPVLINTSFNAAGEPIVCSPADAVRTFLATGLDLLVLGDLVAERPETPGQ